MISEENVLKTNIRTNLQEIFMIRLFLAEIREEGGKAEGQRGKWA